MFSTTKSKLARPTRAEAAGRRARRYEVGLGGGRFLPGGAPLVFAGPPQAVRAAMAVALAALQQSTEGVAAYFAAAAPAPLGGAGWQAYGPDYWCFLGAGPAVLRGCFAALEGQRGQWLDLLVLDNVAQDVRSNIRRAGHPPGCLPVYAIEVRTRIDTLSKLALSRGLGILLGWEQPAQVLSQREAAHLQAYVAERSRLYEVRPDPERLDCLQCVDPDSVPFELLVAAPAEAVA